MSGKTIKKLSLGVLQTGVESTNTHTHTHINVIIELAFLQKIIFKDYEVKYVVRKNLLF